MIARTHRFHGLNALRGVYAHGQTTRSPLFAVKFMINDRRQTYRAAVVVSRKVHKSAVVRNRIRRRMYEIVRQVESRIIQPYDIVITVFIDQVAAMDAAELETSLIKQLIKAGIITRAATPESHAIVVPKEINPA